jgi:hypothetical protein
MHTHTYIQTHKGSFKQLADKGKRIHLLVREIKTRYTNAKFTLNALYITALCFVELQTNTARPRLTKQ